MWGKVSRRLPSRSMTVAITALFIALGGTAYATTTQTDPQKDLTAVKSYLAHHAVPAARLAYNANLASVANSATNATNASNANNANNALSLGGIPASGYTRSDCSSLTGQVKGFMYLSEEAFGPPISSTFVNASSAYNCSGQAVQVRQISNGVYEVKFDGSPATIAVGNVYGDNAFLSLSNVGPGDFYVSIFNPSPGFDVPENVSFGLVTP